MSAILERLQELSESRKIIDISLRSEVSESSYDAIKFCVREWYFELDRKDRDKYGYPYLPDLEYIGPKWLITNKGDSPSGYVGTFIKRIGKYLHNEYKFNLSPELAGKIGSIARDSLSDNTYHMDFTDSFNWEDGDFGDEGSCYWGRRTIARTILREEFDAYAVRFYDNDNNGYGRAWIIPYLEGMLIYNAYPSNFKLATIARIVATYLGLSYSKVGFSINGDTSGDVWINNGCAYHLYPFGNTASGIESVNLEYDTDDYKECTCDRCGDSVASLEDGYYFGDSFYCEDCYNEYVRYCGHCQNDYWHNDGRYINGEWICDSCILDNYTECSNCGEYIHNDDIQEVDGDYYCESCFSRLVECPECGNLVLRLIQVGDKKLCHDCARAYYCDNCNSYHEEVFEISVSYPYNTSRKICVDCLSHVDNPQNSDTFHFRDV